MKEKLAESLRQLDLHPRWLSQMFLATPINAEKVHSKLRSTVERLRTRLEQVPESKPPLDPDAVWRHWTSSEFQIGSLDDRQIRTLCLSPKTATRSQFVNACERHPEILARTSCLVGMIGSYFATWKDMTDRQRVERLINVALAEYKLRNPVVLNYRRNAAELFSANGARWMAGIALSDFRPISRVFEENFVNMGTAFGAAVLNSAVRTFISDLNVRQMRSDEVDLMKRLEYAHGHLLIDQTSGEDFYALEEFLIMSGAAERILPFKDAVRIHVLNHRKLGDPRLQATAGNWAMLSKAAGSRFLGWLARDSIIFFFNYVLPDTSENRRRKDFWLRYYELVRDFQVAVSDRDYYRLLASSKRREIPAFSRVNHLTTSAFIMRFGDDSTGSVVVEFSETGNAAYLFKQKAFQLHVGSLRKDSFSLVAELKNPAREDRIIHNGQWEYSARQKLAALGIIRR